MIENGRTQYTVLRNNRKLYCKNRTFSSTAFYRHPATMPPCACSRALTAGKPKALQNPEVKSEKKIWGQVLKYNIFHLFLGQDHTLG
jgi:hypothetical protein